HPYQAVELEADLNPAVDHSVAITLQNNQAVNIPVPNEFLRLGRPRAEFDVFQQPAPTTGNPPSEPMNALYITRQEWIGADGLHHQLNRGDTLQVTYVDFGGGRHQETLIFPSERDPGDRANTIEDSIGQASDRLEATGEGPALANSFEYANMPRAAMVAARST